MFGVPGTPLYSIPLGSPTGPQKRSYVPGPACEHPVPSTSFVLGGGLGASPGRYTGWVYRVGNTGAIPTQPLCSRRVPEAPATAGSGPSPRGGGGWVRDPDVQWALRNTLNIDLRTRRTPVPALPRLAGPTGAWRGLGPPGHQMGEI